MPDFMTPTVRHVAFVRRVPVEFAEFDRRGAIRDSAGVPVSSDSTVSADAKFRRVPSCALRTRALPKFRLTL